MTKDVLPAPIPRKSVQRTSETAAPIKAFPCRIDLSGLAPCLSKKQLYKKVRKFGDVKEIEFEDGKTEATIVYASKKDGENAIKHLHEHSFKGSKLEAKLSVSVCV